MINNKTTNIIIKRIVAGFCLFTGIAIAAMPDVPVPSENPITESKRILGKILFWDEQLSSDDTVACGTCHIISNGGTDPRPAAHPGMDSIFGTADDVVGSKGIVHYDENMQIIEDESFGFQPQVTDRNTPSFINAMYANDIFWDGRAKSQFMNPENPDVVSIISGGALESQAVVPILSSVEMAKENRTWDDVIVKLISIKPLALASNIPSDIKQAIVANPNYPDLFNQAFGDSTITAEKIGMAIATYERTLVSDQTPWDLYMAGDSTAMTADQIAGWEFFQNGSGGGMGGGMGNGNGPNCAMCHTPPLFTDNKFYNIGLRPAQEDAGRMTVTNNSDDFGSFKTPGLRNIGLKSAMMHVGWITDTMDSIDFYNAGTADVTSGHVQFIENQSGLPTPNPNAPMQPPYSMITLEVDSEANQSKVADFIDNALTDPRVASESFPFDRPFLNSEITHPINSGLNGAWYNPETSGQGILLEILPNSNKAFFAWFTYDTSTPDSSLANTIGSTDHRWLTGLGDINMQEKSITFEVKLAKGGLFDNNRPITNTTTGTVTITFESCSAARVNYSLLDESITGEFPMIRISSENNILCEQLLTGNITKAQKTSATSQTTKADGNMHVNSGLNGAWYNTETSGQGFLIEVLPQSNKLFMAWFTYDTDLPSDNATAVVGDAGHRWLTGIGDIDPETNSVVIDIKLTSNGLFDNPQTVSGSDPMTYGSLTFSFDNCSNAKVDYNLSSLNIAGTIPLVRISDENLPLCEQLIK